MDPVISFQNVSFRYDEEAPYVLKNIHFSIMPNETVAIIGHNGSGKSTIAKLMNGLLFPNEGKVVIDSIELSEATIWDIRERVGMVFQNPDNQFVGTTVQDDVAFGMENRGIPRKEMLHRIDEALRAVHMEQYRLTEPHRLSGGQKQRIAIAGVIAISPQVIILDEATVMLDPRGRKEMMETIATLQQEEELSLIMITHDLHEVVQADRVIVLNEGEIWAIDTPKNILQHGEKLQQIGLDIPFMTQLALELRKENVQLAKTPVTIEEMLTEIATIRKYIS